MKLHQYATSFIFLALLAGCEGHKEKETKLGITNHTVKQSLETNEINGKIFILQRIALPDNAVVTVTLTDTSMVGLPALILSQKYYDTQGKQSPFPFKLSYQKDEVPPNAYLTVSATISVDGETWFITEKKHEVINNGITKDIELVLVPAQ
ncbi:YbaY family lipoprotein [Providencia burhodogranariea]|uniref:Lipoprotein n=1 Tax=Providencia burhodogranariea DSM 19968 TaxID=1141662 RepID=K8WDS9_9GAMM|nr:YbaY family lipoprotein [Providencia burhodogranariea]EKT54360.1 hypothetical protein OOA_17036 [Providencia burhodogranariea DSM 19968]